jgi:tetratricopeptide (TPR) repeat protein
MSNILTRATPRASGLRSARSLVMRTATMRLAILAIALMSPHSQTAANPDVDTGTATDAATDIATPGTTTADIVPDPEAPEVAAFEQAVAEQLDTAGPYQPALAETYYSYGRYLQQQAHHAEAVVMFNKALHIERINGGIHGAAQTPALRAIILSHKSAGQFAATTTYYEQLLWLTRKNLPPNDPHLIPVLREVARWHLAAQVLDDEPRRREHLYLANDLLAQANALARTAPADTETRVALLRDNALASFYIDRYIDRNRRDLPGTLPATSGYRYGGDDLETAPGAIVQSLLPGGYRPGRAAHEAILELLPATNGGNSLQHLQAQIELGDWHLLFDRKQPAMAYYQRALALAPTVTPAAHWFEQPVALPAARAGAKPGLTVAVRLDISAQGQPSNIEVLDAGQFAEPQLARRIALAVRDTRFRPRFTNGQPVSSRGELLRFPLAD